MAPATFPCAGGPSPLAGVMVLRLGALALPDPAEADSTLSFLDLFFDAAFCSFAMVVAEAHSTRVGVRACVCVCVWRAGVACGHG